MYIALAMVALRPTRPVAVRATAWLGALATFAYIASVALTKDPAEFLRLIPQ
jgi:uncharacterized membrane protein SirB2